MTATLTLNRIDGRQLHPLIRLARTHGTVHPDTLSVALENQYGGKSALQSLITCAPQARTEHISLAEFPSLSTIPSCH